MGKNRSSKTGFPGNQSQPWNKNSNGNGKSNNDLNKLNLSTASVKSDLSQEQANILSDKALGELTEADLEMLDSSPPENFELKDVWQKAQVFDRATKNLENELQQIENQKLELNIQQSQLQVEQNALAEQRKKLDEEFNLVRQEREQLNQHISTLNQQERQLQEREANARFFHSKSCCFDPVRTANPATQSRNSTVI